MKRLIAGALAGLLAFAPLAQAQPPKPAYVSGSITTGALTKFAGPQSVAVGNLSGDCATVNSLAVICLKTNGVSFGAFATGTDAANLTGTVSVNRFNSGTGASSSTFLRGDGWRLRNRHPHGRRPDLGQLIVGNGSADLKTGDLSGDVSTSGSASPPSGRSRSPRG
jgi:hypothetical protein